MTDTLAGLDTAACLLAAVPRCLLDSASLDTASPDHLTADLIGLLDGCLDGRPDALHRAEIVCKSADGIAPNTLEESAAADLFLRAVAAHNNAKLIDFVLDRSRHLFRTPPLIEKVSAEFPPMLDSALEGADVLICQHLMASSVPELTAIRDAVPGLTVVDVIGKPYSANRLAVLELVRRGFPVNLDSCEMPDLGRHLFGSYKQRHRQVVAESVSRYVAARGDSARPLLVIDDGGALINAVGQQVMAGAIRGPVVAVEQTTHGMYALDRKFFTAPASAGFAVVSVASSLAKLGHESRLIARSVLDASNMWIDLLGHRGHRPAKDIAASRIGIIGFGVIGATVARDLGPTSHGVAVFDRSRHKTALAHAEDIEMAWSLQNLLQYADIVIGASGGKAVDEAATASLRDEAVLISASSGDNEFRGLNGWELTLEPILPRAGLTPFDHAHGLVRATDGDRTVLVVNRGFPVNFDGSPDPIPLDKIQLTRALMLGAVLHAAGVPTIHQKPLAGLSGEYELNETIDRFLAQQAAP